MFRTILLILIVISLISISAPAFAYSTPIENGISWLTGTQNPDGTWGSNAGFAALDTSVVLDTLKSLGVTSPSYANGVMWLSSQSLLPNDFLSRRILSLYSAGINVSTDLTLLTGKKNSDGGWSGDDDPVSLIQDTALALQALKKISYPDQNVISFALGYLTSTQNPDGGWAFRQAQDADPQDSNVYMTAVVLNTLSQFKSIYNLQTPINNAVAYLLTKQNVDGGFGSGGASPAPTSTIYETSLAFEALIASGAVGADKAANMQNAVNYITSTQLPNGSWSDDPYSTALALRVINSAGQIPQPTTGTITGSVVDASTNQPLTGASVVIASDPTISTLTDAAGGFMLSNIPPGSQTINISLPGYTTASVTANVTAGSMVNLGTIPLSAGLTTGIIKGTVKDAANNQPLGGVTITVTGSFSGSTATGADGSFVFTGVTPGSVTITASKTGYYSVTGTGTVVGGGTLFFNPLLSTTPPPTATGNLIGKVFDSSTNKPIQGATISISGGPSTSTDSQGLFLIQNIAPSTYQVTISASGYISQSYQVMIIAGVTTDMQTIYLSPSPQSTAVTGKVMDSSTGGPIAGADVTVPGTSLTVKTDPAGTYIISGISLLAFDIRASAAGYESATFHVTTTGYGTYVVNFSLNSLQLSNLKAGGITFSDPNPVQGDTVTISASILNTGYTQAVNILVRFYDGDPASGGVQIGADQTIPSLMPNGSFTVGVTYNSSGKTGRHNIYVVVDPLNAIKELDETDNVATSALTILLPPDLFIDNKEITFTPVNPTVETPLTITFVVRNIGEKDVGNVPLRLYKGDPQNGGTVLDNYTIAALNGNGRFEQKVTINNPPAGTSTFYLVADPDNVIAEANEQNNTGNITINVDTSRAVDLSIYPSNITLELPPNAKPGDIFTVKAVVRNTGSANVLQTDVAFYNGNPLSGGTLLGRTTMPVPAFGTWTAMTHLTLPSGNPIIYVFVDPDNLIPEADETNNIAYVEIGPSHLPDFVLTDNLVRYYPVNPTPKSSVTIEADVFNYGGSGAYTWLKLYEGAPESGGVLKGSFTPRESNYIDASMSRTFYITLTNLTLGDHEFYIIADPDNQIKEINETNNRAVVRVTVTNNPQIDLYITRDDITFNPELPLAGTGVQITANVHNSGNEAASGYASLYNGNPATGGKLINYRVNFSVEPGSSQALSQWFTMTTGVPEIYVVVDDDNRVPETDETNNIASRTIDTYRYDLSVSTRDISLNPVIPNKGDIETVVVNVQSTGLASRTASLKLYEGTPENGRLIGTQDFSASGKQVIQLSFPSYAYPGDGTTLTAVIDNINPPEDNLSNNRATAIFGEHIEGNSNEGTEFWIAWPPGSRDANIIIQSKYNADFTVNLPSSGVTRRYISGTVSPGLPARIPLEYWDGVYSRLNPSIAIENKGIHITSNKEVSVIFHTPLNSNVTDDSYLALPVNILGTEYYVVSYIPVLPSEPAGYSFVAVEDNTNIRVGNNVINLNRGQTYHYSSPLDLTGTHVRSDKPITVIASTVTSDVPKTVPRTGYADSLLEQMLPVSLLGMDYFTAPLYSPGSSDIFRVLAVQDNTEIMVKDAYITRSIVLNSGQWTEFANEDALHITATKPISVMQYAKGITAAGVGDPFQMTIIPTDKLRSEYRFYTYPQYEHGNFVTIIAPEPDTVVMLDGAALNTAWTPLPDKGNYLMLPVNIGEHVVSANKPVAVYAHGYRQYGSYGYPAGLSFPLGNIRIDSPSVSPSAPTEGQLVEIIAIVSNDGNRPLTDVKVRAYDGDPASGGVQIGEDVYISIIYPKESQTVKFVWDTFGFGGTNNIHVIVDPLNTIAETIESDNSAMITVVITPPLKPDPAVTDTDVLLSQVTVNEGDTVVLSAKIKNRGTAVSDVPVSLYLGDPKNGGLLLESRIIRPIIPLHGEVVLEFAVHTVGFRDVNDLYLFIDPDNVIDELIETNNAAVKRLMVNRKKLPFDVLIDKARYQAQSDMGISVYIRNESLLSWSGTGDIYIEDGSGQKVAHVTAFTVNDLKPLGAEGWHYRALMAVTETRELKDAIAVTTVNFNSLLSSLGVSGKTVDLNSIRVYEFDGPGNFLGEKNARFEKDSGFDIVTKPTGKLFLHMDGITPANQTRYFYLYLDTTDNGPKTAPLKTSLPQKGKVMAFSGYWGELYVANVNGDGTFGAPVRVDSIPVSLLNGIELADFNNDGFPDLISGDGYGNVYYYQNRADGTNTFLPRVKVGAITVSSWGYYQQMTSGDYNNDGNRDFLISTYLGDAYLFLGNGDGTFTQRKLTYYPNKNVGGKASADLNNDGNVDLVVGDYGTVSILFGNGKGEFGSPVEIGKILNTNNSYKDIYSLSVGDINNDGYLDVIVNGDNDGIAYVLYGMGGAKFGPAVAVPSLKTASKAGYDLFDINGDGKLDVMVAQYNPSKLLYFEGNGDGSFKTPVSIPSPATYYTTAVSVSNTRINPEVVANSSIAEKIEGKLYQFIWNTGSTPPGNYKVHVSLSEGQGIIADGYASFGILADARVSSNVVVDKISYKANELVTITLTIQSLSANTIFENLTARVSVASPAGQTLYMDAKAVPILVPGQLLELKTYWNTGTNPPGVYPVIIEITDTSGTVLSTTTTNLTISSTVNPKAVLRGQISVDRQSILQGDPVNITYSITNIGNVDLPLINLSIQTVHVLQLTVYDTLTDQTGLLMGQTYANTQQLATNKYSAKDYLVVLRANISGVEETLAGTYFRVEGAPSAPSLNSPQHGQDVLTLTPTLTVNNASDPNDDKLTYEFDLYSDSSLTTLIAVSAAIAEGINVTSWQVPLALQENSTYFWRARAYDGRLYGDWMIPAAFRVNIANDPPTAPTLSSPAHNSQVGTLTPVLTVNNATDPDSANLTYNFELALDANFTQIVSSTVGVFEGAGSTSWQVPVALNDNTYYYWRAQADDWLTTGPWMTTARFFVNTVNDAPTAPVIIAPPNNSEVTALSADIVASNSADPDSPQLTYVFELDTMPTFDSPGIMRSGSVPEGQGTTLWRVNGLTDNTFYYVRVKASDGLAESPWSQVVGFFVNTANDAPTIPLLANPSDGGAVNVFTPTLSVHNSSDIDRDILTYEFELYTDAAMTSRVANAANIQETPEITSWTVPVSLTENNIYYWRARAFDGQLYSGWMPLASFMVNTANDAPGAPTLYSPANGTSLDTLTPTLAVHNAIDPDSDALTYDFEMYSGGVLVRTITGILQNVSGITSVTLAQALSDNTTYTWRARAYDGDRYGAWMDMATFSIHIPSTNITATIDFDPNTLNKKSSGKWVVVYIELPIGYNVSNISVPSIRLNGSIPAEPWPYALGDYDNDGIPDLMVKFSRSAVINILPNGDNVPVHVTGTVGATTFEGVDTIRVIP